MKWITRERVKVDRVACPWLIRKFIDPQAEFLFVPADEVLKVAEREEAVPYVVPNVEFGHHGQPALILLAKIVKGADAVPLWTLFGFGDTGQLRGRSALDRRAEESHGGSGHEGSGCRSGAWPTPALNRAGKMKRNGKLSAFANSTKVRSNTAAGCKS